MSENPNQHILSYLTYYVSHSEPPRYALMITGRWGAGKTWLIRQHIKSDTAHKYLYVSLYGAKTAEEIGERIYAVRHPILASTGAVIAGRLLKNVLKATLPIDLDGNGKDDLQLRPELPDITDKLRSKPSTDDYTLVFDDIERCTVDGNELWGFINQLVEHENAKVILLTCEDEIKDESYRRTKEKNIGMTLGVNPDAEGVLDSLIREADDPGAGALRTYRARILQLFERSGCESLRVLRFTVRDFCRIFAELPSKLQGEPLVMSRLINSTFSLAFGIYSGELKSVDIKPVDIRGLIAGSKEPWALSGITEKYKSIPLGAIHPSFDWWQNFFGRGEVRRPELIEEFTSLVGETPVPDWLRLARFDELSDSEFEGLLDETWDSLTARRYRSLGAILHVAGTHMWAVGQGVTKSSRKVPLILEEAKKSIDSLEDKDILESFVRGGQDGAAGIVYAARTTPEFIELLKQADSIFESAKTALVRLEARRLLQAMRSGGQAFASALETNLDDGGALRALTLQASVLAEIDADEFVKLLIRLSHRDQGEIIKALYERMKRRLTSEREWVEQVIAKLAEQKEPSLQNLMLRTQLKQLIE